MTRLVLLLIPALLTAAKPGAPAPGGAQEVSRACTVSEVGRFTAIEKTAQGVDAVNPQHPKTGQIAAKRWLVTNWEPLHPDKQVLCGTLHDFKYHNGPGKELDWNLWTVPSSEYQVLIEIGKARADPGGLLDCRGQDDCLEGEITPEAAFLNTRYFPRDGKSPLVDQSVCMYGPFVSEMWHNSRPEIHPIESVWWKEASSSRTFVVIGRDASNRFDTDDDYNTIGDSTTKGRPWSKAPLDADVRIGVRAPIGAGTKWTATRLEPPPSGSSPSRDLTLTADGATVFTLSDSLSGYPGANVSIEDACRHGSDVLAYARLQAQISAGTSPMTPGFLMAVVGPPSASPFTAAQDEPPHLELEASTLRRTTVNGVSTLVIDGRIGGMPAGAQLSGVDIRPLSAGRGVAAPVPRPSVASGNRVAGVPALAGGIVVLQTAAGSIEIPQQRIGMLARIVATPEGNLTADRDAWSSVRSMFADALPSELTGGLDVVRIPLWRLHALAAYGPIDNGRVGVEEDHPVSTALNMALIKAGPDRVALFGTTPPLRAEWSADVAEGTSAASKEGPVSNDFIVPLKTGSAKEGTATVTVMDEFGNRATARHTLSSHGLRAKDGPTLARLTATLAMALKSDVRDAQPGTAPRAVLLRRGAVESAAVSAASDGLVTTQELRSVLKAAGYSVR